MIGSDWPVCTVAASYAGAMGVVKDYIGRQSLPAQQAILGGNAQRFWKLKSPVRGVDDFFRRSAVIHYSWRPLRPFFANFAV